MLHGAGILLIAKWQTKARASVICLLRLDEQIASGRILRLNATFSINSDTGIFLSLLSSHSSAGNVMRDILQVYSFTIFFSRISRVMRILGLCGALWVLCEENGETSMILFGFMGLHTVIPPAQKP